MEELIYVDRRNSNCNKWDGQTAMFGEEGLHAMWVADMDFKIPQCVQKALHEYVDFGAIGYYRIPDGYYDAFINWEKKHFNFEVKREWLRFAPGVVAAFNWMIQMLTKKEDAVIVMTPVYYPFLQAVTNNERKLITSDLVNENGNYTIDFDDFEKKIVDNDVKAFILCSPHNPVGRVWRKEELKEMLEICHRHHVYVISDEIHQDFVFGDKKQTPSYLMTEHWDEILTITAPSKTFNLAGLVGSYHIVYNSYLRDRLMEAEKCSHYNSANVLSISALMGAYTKEGAEWVDELREILTQNVDYAHTYITTHFEGVSVAKAQGTYMLYLDCSGWLKEHPEMTMDDLIRAGIAVGVVWQDGRPFMNPNTIRMNLAVPHALVKEAMDRLDKYVFNAK